MTNLLKMEALITVPCFNSFLEAIEDLLQHSIQLVTYCTRYCVWISHQFQKSPFYGILCCISVQLI